ncbi:MAG: hypothetical protein M0T73_00895 [Deltaproteobacteria bacterium]|nr:hypothetical protein [Deltaproteobacteria bacterium]
MGLDPEIKLLEDLKGVPIFEQVEAKDLSELHLLDEAIIICEEAPKPKADCTEIDLSCGQQPGLKPPDLEIGATGLAREFSPSMTDFGRLIQASQVFPTPMIPMGLAIIALIVAATFGHA